MPINFNTNMPAVGTQKRINSIQESIRSNFQKLASGKKINSAADGAAALAITTELSSHVRSLAQAQRNTMDGVSMAQTAEGGMEEMSESVIRMRELAMQAANGTLSDDDRAAINTEFTALREEVDRISNTTQFNGQNLLDGSASGVNLQIGTGSDPDSRITMNIDAANSATLGDGVNNVAGQTLATAGEARDALGVLDGALSGIAERRSTLGAIQNTLAGTERHLAVERENIMAARSRIEDVDYAQETMKTAQNQILNQAGVSVLAQANQLPAIGLSLLG